MISETEQDMELKIWKYNKLMEQNRHFGKPVTIYTKLCVHNITSQVVLRCGSEVVILNEKYTRKFEAPQTRFRTIPVGQTNTSILQYYK
jgi:hypothetical protein